jgi:hypothetical protein
MKIEAGKCYLINYNEGYYAYNGPVLVLEYFEGDGGWECILQNKQKVLFWECDFVEECEQFEFHEPTVKEFRRLRNEQC